MICDICGKNEAQVKLIAVIDGMRTERNLCMRCMEQQKQQLRSDGMQSMLSAIIARTRRDESGFGNVRCSHCGLSLEAFRKSSRLGCAQCYTDFKVQLRPLLQRLHGATRHTGRIPAMVDEETRITSELEQIRREMEVAVACEEFEQAAILRDKLRTMSAAMGEAKAHE